METVIIFSVIFILAAMANTSLRSAKQNDTQPTPLPTDGFKDTNGFHVFCFTPKAGWPVLKLFSSLYVEVKPSDNDTLPVFYFGQNATEVHDKQSSKGVLQSYIQHMAFWPQLETRMSVHEEACLGVEMDKPYRLRGKTREVDMLYFGLFIAGLLVFLSAPVFSRSVYFHYSTGVTVGILASLLVIIYILSRFIPKKLGAGAFLIGGWTIVVYFMRQTIDSLLTSEYRDYIAIYFVVAGFLSFVVCYWYGPVESERTIHILEGTLYALGSLLIFGGVQYKPAAAAIIVILGSLVFLQRKGFLSSSRCLPTFSAWRWWLRSRYIKRRLLSIDEYEQQGQEETRKALTQLREYCNSPKCNSWKMISRMDTPERFAHFVMGEDHVSDNELTLYESDLSLPPEDMLTNDSLLTSDDDE